MKFDCNPDQTWAVVVGVEKYAADWPLDGPTNDAVRFMKWLRLHGVPANQIFAFLSPLEKNYALAAYCETEHISRTEPTRDAIEVFLTDTLPPKIDSARQQSGHDQMLLLTWGGHGVVTNKLERRLFYSNATSKDKLSVPFDSIRALLRSQRYASAPTQVAIIDACASHYKDLRSNVEIKGGEIGGDELTAADIKQCFLYSAEAGQISANNSQTKSGKFSALILAELDGLPTYPPDFIAIHEVVRKKLEEMRNTEELAQTPVLYVSDIAGLEQVWWGDYPETVQGPTLFVEQITDTVKQKDDLLNALCLLQKRMLEENKEGDELYDLDELQELIKRHLAGMFGPHRPSACWKAYVLVAKCASEAVGFLLAYDDREANYSFMSYLVAKDPEPNGENALRISARILDEWLRIRQQDTQLPIRVLTEVDHPATTEDPEEQKHRLARVRLFTQLAENRGTLILRCLDLKYVQPPLDPNKPEKQMLLLYGSEGLSLDLPKSDVVEALTWLYTGLYSEDIFEDPVEAKWYGSYNRQLLKRSTDALPARIRLLRGRQLCAPAEPSDTSAGV